MNDDFNYFLESVLIETASSQSGSSIKPVFLRNICLKVQADAPPTWVDAVGDQLRALNLGEILQDTEARNAFWFEMNGAGLARAHEAKAKRRKPTPSQRLRSLPWGKGIWDVVKIGLGVVIGAIGSHYFGK